MGNYTREEDSCSWLRRRTWSSSASKFTDMFGALKNIADGSQRASAGPG